MLTVGFTFAGYTVERLIGQGGMGEVYLARHPRLPRSDALKLMSGELSRNEVYRRRFTAEAEVASTVQHDAVVRVYDRGEDDGRLWIAMEYIDGRDLAQILIEEQRLEVDRAVRLIERIAGGLDAIHSKGLLHRDVKPANILVARDMPRGERALLTDFGIARSAADSLGLTGVGDIVATLHYAAPEQFELRTGELDHRVDVYALGCVLYEMITGEVPLKGDSVASFWAIMQSQTPIPPSQLVAGIPPRLDAVIAKALAKRREDRYDSAGEFAEAAREALTGEPATVASPRERPVGMPTLTAEAIPLQTSVSPATGPVDSTVPFRISLRRQEFDGPRQYGPLSSEQLSAADVERVGWLIKQSQVFALDERILGGYGPEAALTVEVPGRFHTVTWQGQPPALLTELVNEVSRLGGGSAPAVRKRRRGRLAALAAIVVVAIAVPVILLATAGGTSKPGTPTDVRTAAGPGTVAVHWTPGSGKTDHYVVYRDGQPIASSVRQTTFIDTLDDTKPHRYTVQAVNAAGTSSPQTPPETVSALLLAPGIPTNPTATAGPGTVTVRWSPGSGKTDHYVVYRDGHVIASTVRQTSYVDKLNDIRSHSYTVQAVNAAGATSQQTPPQTVAALLRPLNDQEKQLLAKLPNNLVSEVSCKPITSAVDVHVSLAVTCSPGPGQTPKPPGRVPRTIEVYSSKNDFDMNAALTAQIAGHHAKTGACSAVPQAGGWNFTQTPNVQNGKLICYTVGPTSYIIWSYTSQRIYLRAVSLTGYPSLLAWWQGVNLHLPT